MDTIRYRAFLLAVEKGSIRKAAETLDYTPSAVSQLIQALESELNTTLLLRNKKQLRLTTAGAVLLPSVRRILAEEDLMLQTAAGMNGLIIGTINIAAYHSLAAAWLPSVIQVFHKDYPHIQINIFEGTQQDIIARLLNGQAELGFFNDSAMKEKHDWIPLMDTPMMAVVPIAHPLAGKSAFPIECFDKERFIMTDQGMDYDVMNYLKENGVTPDICLSTIDTYVLLEMVEKGLGSSIVTAVSLHGKENGGRLKAIPITPAAYVQMGIAVPSLETASPAVLKFISYVRPFFEKKSFS